MPLFDIRFGFGAASPGLPYHVPGEQPRSRYAPRGPTNTLMTSEKKRLKSNGLNFVVTDYGKRGATPVVLLHGFPNSANVWEKQASSITHTLVHESTMAHASCGEPLLDILSSRATCSVLISRRAARPAGQCLGQGWLSCNSSGPARRCRRRKRRAAGSGGLRYPKSTGQRCCRQVKHRPSWHNCPTEQCIASGTRLPGRHTFSCKG